MGIFTFHLKFCSIAVETWNWQILVGQRRFVMQIRCNVVFCSRWNLTNLIFLSPSRNTTACGTLDYLAPEIVGHKQYQYQVDNWCVGVLAYELLAGRAPFEGTDDETKSNIANIKYTFPDYFSPLARRFIENVRRLHRALIFSKKGRLVFSF